VLLGAGLMALLDPVRGRTRRALIRDKAIRGARKLGDAAGTMWRDLSHRLEVQEQAEKIVREEPPAETPEPQTQEPPRRKRPVAARGASSEPAPGGNGPT
jgi:hypothetical protein